MNKAHKLNNNLLVESSNIIVPTRLGSLEQSLVAQALNIVSQGDLTEGDLNLWTTFASDGANTQISYDSNYLKAGTKSLKFVTNSGFDTGIRYNVPQNSYLDLSQENYLFFWAYAINNNPFGFQGNQPIIEINSPTGSIRYEPQNNLMVNDGWRKYAIPLNGDSQWVKTIAGQPDISKVTSFEIHQDTWDYGFTVYYDGIEFVNFDNNYLPPQGPPPPANVNPDAIAPKILLYVFDPIMENKGGQRQHQAYGWDDPVLLTNQVIKDLQTSSHGLVNYQLADIQIVDKHPYFEDGFQHTDESFDQAWNIRDFHNSQFDYSRFIQENNLTKRIDSGEIDEVWIYAGPIAGLWESTMAGQGAYWINGPVQNANSDRAYPIMGFNFERGVGEALHSFGHRAESVMDHIYGPQSPNLNNNWNKFTFQDRYQTGLGGVGNIHFPVNGVSDYDYANTKFVNSNADDWYNYPNFQGITRSFNYREWSPNGTDPQREYLNWWYDHLPHFSGRGTDYYLNNWWRYITDINQFKFSNGNLYLTTGIPTVAIKTLEKNLGKGTFEILADASVDGALGRVDLYVDGSYFATDTLFPYTFNLPLNQLVGNHVLVAKAYELQNGTESISSTKYITIGTNGNDTLSGTTNNDKIEGLGGSDRLFGLAGNDTLDGGSGQDTMTGGTGDDIYVSDNSGDRIVENANEGTDTVRSSISYTLGNNLENLILTGTSNLSGNGNLLNNLITGNSGNNTLDGKAGSDIMSGGLGNDTYVVDSLGDIVSENANEGTDTVKSAINYTLENHLERLTLTGTANINGTGNSLNNIIVGNSGNNKLTGGDGNDLLDGKAGNDTISGGLGNDTYVVDSLGDIVSENANEGTDTVKSAINYTLENHLERLTLTGTANINGTGNSLNNIIVGNSGNNKLNGGDGNDSLNGASGNDTLIGGLNNDTLTGGSGFDYFTFNTPNQGIDRINDFVVGEDKIAISAASFGGGLTKEVALTAEQFIIGTTRTTQYQRFIYNQTDGKLWFDVDGTGSSSQVQIATLSKWLKLSNNDFTIL
ncbi:MULTISPECIES: calcium-binding protein [Calothrix]|uniref:Calcium-binding protein n=2 Tax=Calothrix TaxID=1186 RepID=A0ABR8A2U0_9CYAN|nr:MULTISPECIES: calcium-binding protein [Calothrix]MBD2194206.1 calcium-binding protein [Calothrix parietina FACHB-288]MBD2225002.1 calcium-binding protein [Calothrix anomala FACHB-343]